MLSAVPVVRRRCSVRSVATAAKKIPSTSQPQENDIPQMDRAAALARSKWAPRPKLLPDISYNMAVSPTPAGNRSDPSTASETAPVPGVWAAKLASTSKWARPTPTPNSVEAAPVASSSKTAPASRPTRDLETPSSGSSRARWPSLSATTLVTPDSNATDGSNDYTRPRSKWSFRPEGSEPGGNLLDDLRSDVLRSAARAAERTIPPPPPPPAVRLPTNQWTMPQPQSTTLPPHLRWQPPDPTASASPPVSPPSTSRTRFPSLAPLHSAMDKILPHQSPSSSPTHDDPRLQRRIAPHLDPSALQRVNHSQTYRTPRDGRAPPAVSMRPAPRPVAIDAEMLPPPVKTIEKSIRSKDAFKERGSLLRQQEGTVAAYKSLTEHKLHAPKPKAKKPWAYVEKHVSRDVYIPSIVSVGNLSKLLNVRLETLQHKMYQAGMGAESNYDHVLTSDYAVLLAEEFGLNPIVNDEAAFDLYPPAPHRDPASLPSRPPVVTIMGHVDHGKTTLLDTLRSSSVAKGEVGGITQHIGAFSVPVPSGSGAGPQTITFLDTPGHAAFSAMRARGAQVTDLIVLVVAADDGIMPQTREVIDLIKQDREKIGVVVAINKIDKPGCDVDALQKALLVENIHLEDMGGDTPSVQVSGLTGKGLPELVETLSLMAEILDLRAEPDGVVFGYVLESKVVKGLGPIATVLVLRGCLNPGSHILSGVHHARVRIMHDSNGTLVKTASPGMAVSVSGWRSLPNAGDEVLQGTESEIKKAIANRQRKLDIEASMRDVEAINSSRQQERDRRQAEAEVEDAGGVAPQAAPKEETPTGPKELRLLIKADVSGSAEAVEGALQGIGNHLAVTKVISSSVGDIMESDIMMAKAVGGVVVGFSVSASRAVENLAGQHGVPIVTNDIIYRLMEEIKARIIKLLPTTTESRVLGEAKVLQLFDITVKGKQTKVVAGSRVINGLIEKTKLARVMRDGSIIFEGTFDTMRHFKKDVTELRKGNECGLSLLGFDELQPDDVIQTYENIEKPGVL